MPSFKTCIFAHQKRSDGSYNIKLRITHNRVSRRIKTNLYAMPMDLTRGLKIKDEKLLRDCQQLERDCVDICNSLGFSVMNMDVDELVKRVKSGLFRNDTFKLDFIEYMSACASRMTHGTGGGYLTALNALKRYINRDYLDIKEITVSFIHGFSDFIENEPSQRGSNRGSKKGYVPIKKGSRALPFYLTRIKTIFNMAKVEYNDEDTGMILIAGNPFKAIKIPAMSATTKRAVDAGVIQKIIDLPPFDNRRAQMARDCFLISFALMGINSVDMFMCLPTINKEIIYYRQKVASRRDDKAEFHVIIEPCIEPLIMRYKDATKKRLFNFHMQYADRVSFNKALNKGLKEVGDAVGVPDLTFYAARHSFATIARTPVVNDDNKKEQGVGGVGLDKYIVHEMLNHIDKDMKVTDIYLVKNWRILWDANRKVLDLFNWKGLEVL